MMAENKTSKNMEIFAKYLEDNQEVAQRYAAMTPAEKKEFEENFFKQARVERLNQLNRGRNSDEWQLTLDNINMNVLTAMNKAPANLAKMPPQKRRDTIDTILDSFTPEENSQFLTLSNQAKKQLLENFPPKKLVATAQKLEELISQTDNAATKQALTSQFNMVNEEIALTINEIASGKIVIDQTNIADVYDGVNLMLDYADKKAPNGQPTPLTAGIRRDILEPQIAIYDEAHGLKDLTPADLAKVELNYKKASKMADKLPLDPNIATVLGNLEFMDADGKPEKDQKAQQALLVETIKAEAARNLAGSKADITEDMVSVEVAKVAATRIGALVMGSEFAMAQNQAQAQAALTGLLNGQKYQVSNSGFVGYNAEYTNSSMGYMDRLAKKIGNTAPVLGQMYKRVKKFDKTCIERFDPAYSQTKKLTKVMRNNCLRSAPMAALGMTLTHVQPYGAMVMAGVCAGYAAVRLIKSYRKASKEAKARGEKFGFMGFMKKHGIDVAITAISATGTALGMPWLGKAAMGLNAGRTAVKTFMEKRKEGDKFWKAAGKAAAAASVTAVTTYAAASITSHALQATGFGSWLDNQFGRTIETGEWVQDKEAHKSFSYSEKDIQSAEKFNETPSRHFEYVGKGHTVADYNNPDNYENRAWYSEEQHEAATRSIREQMTKQGWEEGSEEVMLKKLASFTREYANPDHPLNDGSGRTVGEAFTCKDGNYSVNPQQLLDKVLAGEPMNATDGRLLHNLQFASSPQGHALVDVGIKPEELYSYDTGKPHGVIIDEKAGSGHWETKEVTIPAEPGVFVPAIPYDEQYQAQMLKLNERVGARGHFWATVNKVIVPPQDKLPSQGKVPGGADLPPQDKTPDRTVPPQQGQVSPTTSLDERLGNGIYEPVIDGVNPEASKDAQAVEFGPNYENKPGKKPVKGIFSKIIGRFKGGHNK